MQNDYVAVEDAEEDVVAGEPVVVDSVVGDTVVEVVDVAGVVAAERPVVAAVAGLKDPEKLEGRRVHLLDSIPERSVDAPSAVFEDSGGR